MSGPTQVACARDFPSKRTFAILATLEILGDKLPITPNRIVPLQLVGRISSGAISAAWAFPRKLDDEKDSRWSLALIGGVTAAAVTYLSFYARRELGRKSGVKDGWLGVAEDAIVFTLGSALFAKKSA
jgi:uncharacterized membrane protein